MRDAQDEFKRKETSLMQPVYKDLDAIITKYAEDHKIDLVLNKNNPGVIHASARMDITAEILKEFDGSHKPKDK
ncbi:MAG: Outer membrane protein (OmpH-like) [Deltaproteobacteria bacterium ADurb.Bin510]|nr:MAG: Outer membrane protein (OmpH-like) [Deltaproteobacteria bacterium ADurb.Bin510]